MDPFTMALIASSVIGGGSSLLGGLMNTSSAQAINQANLQQTQLGQQFAKQQAQGAFLPSYFGNLVAGAKGAGLSPLAALGISSPSASFPVGQSQPTSPGAGLADAGQNVSRALSAFAGQSQKQQALDMQAKVLQIQSAREDVVGKQLSNSIRAASLGAAGTPPGLPDGSAEHPFPMFSNFVDDQGRIVPGLSERYSHTQFGPTAYYSGLRAMPGLLKGWLNDALQQAQDYGIELRGDIGRSLNNPPVFPDPYSTYGGG